MSKAVKSYCTVGVIKWTELQRCVTESDSFLQICYGSPFVVPAIRNLTQVVLMCVQSMFYAVQNDTDAVAVL